MHGAHVIGRVSPVARSVEISQSHLCRQSQLDANGGVGNLARDEFKSSSRSLMIEKQTAGTKHSVGFAIVARKFKARDFADSVRTARMKRGCFFVGCFLNFADHARRAGQI